MNERVNKKAVCIMSGGMDSTLSAYMMKQKGYEIIGVHFNYDQRTQSKELECFEKICDDLGVIERYVLDLDFFSKLGASALVDKNIEVPTSGLEDGVPVTYVPFRNGIFISIATAIAEKHQATALFIGVVEEDSSGYPDCRDEYILSMQNSINLGTKEETKLEIKMPLVHMKKEQIVKKSLELKVPLQHTWSCYKQEDKACGVCDSCVLRKNGFLDADIQDPTKYL